MDRVLELPTRRSAPAVGVIAKRARAATTKRWQCVTGDRSEIKLERFIMVILGVVDACPGSLSDASGFMAAEVRGSMVRRSSREHPSWLPRAPSHRRLRHCPEFMIRTPPAASPTSSTTPCNRSGSWRRKNCSILRPSTAPAKPGERPCRRTGTSPSAPRGSPRRLDPSARSRLRTWSPSVERTRGRKSPW